MLVLIPKPSPPEALTAAAPPPPSLSLGAMPVQFELGKSGGCC